MMDYIEAFYEWDTSKINRSVSPVVTKYGFWKQHSNAAYEGMSMSYNEMLAYVLNVIRQPKKRIVGAGEKVEVYEVKDKTASRKITAWWGSDYILLENINGKWLIRMILWQSPGE
jgi:Putative lumazine-binding